MNTMQYTPPPGSGTGSGDFIATVNTEAELAAYASLPAVGNVVRYLDTSGAYREVRCYEVATYVDETDVSDEQIRSTATPTKMLKRVFQG